LPTNSIISRYHDDAAFALASKSLLLAPAVICWPLPWLLLIASARDDIGDWVMLAVG